MKNQIYLKEKKNLNRIVGTQKQKKMTLIIGARFKDGVILVSDRKITDTSTGKFSFEKKLIVPLPIPLIFGAAGFSHKFKQFNRKILEKVDERNREINLLNIAHYNRLGLVFKSIEQEKIEPEKLNTKDIETKDNKESQKEEIQNTPVYIYSTEKFIEDCQQMIRKLCTGADGIIRNDLDVLLGIFNRQGRIHHITFDGEEEEVNYFAIGSGADYVRNFLKQSWSEDMSIEQIIKLCFFCVYYVQDMELDSGVGTEKSDVMPDHLVVTHDGTLGEWTDLNKQKEEIKKEIDDRIAKFKDLQNSLIF